jgi:hypothetical protein
MGGEVNRVRRIHEVIEEVDKGDRHPIDDVKYWAWSSWCSDGGKWEFVDGVGVLTDLAVGFDR